MFGVFKVLNGAERDQKFTVRAGETLVLGSGPGAGGRLSDPGVAAAHARALFLGGRMSLTDAGSAGGTQVNARSITEVELQPGDIVQVGGTKLSFSWSYEDEKSTQAVPVLRLDNLPPRR